MEYFEEKNVHRIKQLPNLVNFHSDNSWKSSLRILSKMEVLLLPEIHSKQRSSSTGLQSCAAASGSDKLPQHGRTNVIASDK
jgi:hypothetical protein